MHRGHIGIAPKEVFQGFPHRVAVNIVYGVEVEPGAAEVGQNGAVEGDVGRTGIEQDSVAIKGYQLDHLCSPVEAAGGLPIIAQKYCRFPPARAG